MARKARSDSAASAVDTFSRVSNLTAAPLGVTLDDEDEKILWDQFTKTRAPDAWREFDLVLLSKIVKIEARIRKHQKELDAMGAVIENQRGTQIENPLFRIVDTLTRQQMAVIRSMSLNQTESHPRTLNATGQKTTAAKNSLDSFDDELIPRLRAIK
jgi:hypothetical protein